MASTPLDELTAPAAAPPDPPADPPAEPAPARRSSRASRLLFGAAAALVCCGFVTLSVLQRPGEIVGDTKLDLVVDPIGFLGRALTLWDAEGAAGQLQNQAYGYFFPMGPFFALGDLAGVEPWLVQRLWHALLMSVAFLGVVVLARRLGIGTPVTAMAAGIAYALAPRMLTSIGAVSAELVPMALTPWVLVPLAGVAVHGSARRAALRSGLAVACIGGVNATATAAALPLAALFLLTRPPGPLRRRLIGWWALAVGLATAWWAVPLLLFGRYAPRFLDYIETAAVTTGPTDVLSVLRGTSHWIALLETPDGPVWPAGWALVEDVTPAAATVLLAAAGLAALCRSDLRERRWLVLGVLTGVFLVSMGHLAAVDGLAAGWLHEALDGPLAPLRNVHKFDPVLRLPLALGLAHLAAVLVRRGGSRTATGRVRVAVAWAGRTARLTARAVLATALTVTLVAAAAPALTGRLLPETGFDEVPGYWEETADFLADEQPSGRALLVPGSAFATYVWGSATDEPMQPLARSPWDVRNLIPLTPEGHIRMLDAVEQRLSRGEASPGLAPFLARAGFSHLVLRNDLDPTEPGVTRAALVRQALAGSPGITPVAAFGPVLRAATPRYGFLADARLDEPSPAIQVYAVADVAPAAWTAPLSSAVAVHGGPDALLPLEDRGLITGRPTVTAGDEGVSAGQVVVSDALVRRERNIGRVAGATSAGLSLEDPRRLDTPVRDYPLPDMAGAESVVEYLGGTISASGSASDPDGYEAGRLDRHPWSAVDGDPLTAWLPSPWAHVESAAWWRLTTDQPFPASEVTVTLGARLGFQRPKQLRLTTDAGTVTVPVVDTGEPQVLPLPAGDTTSVTIGSVVVDGDVSDGYGLALAEVGIPGVEVQRTVVTPQADGPVDVYAFDTSGGRSGCVVDDAGTPRCAAALVDAGEERLVLDRTFDTLGAADHELTATALPRLGPDLDALLAQVRGGPAAEATSSTVWDPRGSPAAAVDGDPRTTWLAGGDDGRPLLFLTFPEPRTIDSLRVVTDPSAPASAATAVTVYAGDPPRTVPLDDDGWARFEPVETDRLTIAFEEPVLRKTVDPPTGEETRLGIGVSELEVGGPNPAAAPETPVALPCGSGPDVQVDGLVLRTAATTTLGALTAVRPIPLDICSDAPRVALAEGEHRLQARAGQWLAPASVTLTRAGGPATADRSGRTPVERTLWDAEARVVEVGARSEPTLLVVPENANPGWTARLDGQELEAVTVDGWQQGYVLPEGDAGTVRLEFMPATAYRLALAVGAGAVLLLAVLAFLPARPSRVSPRPARRSTLAAAGATVALLASLALGLAMIGGVLGVAALGPLWLVGWCLGRWRGAVLGTLAAAALLYAGWLLLETPDSTGREQQEVAIVALAAAAAAVLPGRGSWRRRREPLTATAPEG